MERRVRRKTSRSPRFFGSRGVTFLPQMGMSNQPKRSDITGQCKSPGRSPANLADPREHRAVSYQKHPSKMGQLNHVESSILFLCLLRMYSRVSHTQWEWDPAAFFMAGGAVPKQFDCLRTGQNEDTIRKDLMRDNFMSAEEADKDMNSLSSVATLCTYVHISCMHRRRNMA